MMNLTHRPDRPTNPNRQEWLQYRIQLDAWTKRTKRLLNATKGN